MGNNTSTAHIVKLFLKWVRGVRRKQVRTIILSKPWILRRVNIKFSRLSTKIQVL